IQSEVEFLAGTFQVDVLIAETINLPGVELAEGEKKMKRILATFFIIAATLVPLKQGWAQFDCRGEGEKTGHFETPAGDTGTITVTVGANGKVEKVVFQVPCENEPRVFDLGPDPVYLADGIIVDLNTGVSLTDFSCDGEGGIVGALSLGSVCDGAFEANPTPITVAPGAPPTNGGGQDENGDDDDDSGSQGGGENDPLEEGRRVPIANVRPVAQLLGIEFEANPSTIDMRRVASGVADVSFTARLVWSNDNLPKDFKQDPTQWNFLGLNDNGEWDTWESESSWGTSMWNHLKMEVYNSPEQDSLGKADDLHWNFKIDRSNLDRDNIRNRQIPVRAVYRAEEGNPDSEIDEVVNLRIENQSTINPLATSPGPAERIVTYRRILD
ncbi:MAG: hypothetical protein KC964_18170, partial [Candidatus Omnitrophica bacterium]|nr:hypothetical protein [Candidatus Omnitrophota bacterium]